jgi:hypothetical protein
MATKYAKSIVVEVSIPKKKKFTHVSMPLFVGSLNGFNEDGIAVNSHQIRYIDEEIKNDRLATPLLVRMMLENAKNLKSADKIARNNITTRALNIMVTSRKEEKSIILEIHPHMMNAICNKGHSCCVTYYQSPHMQKLHNDSLELPQTRLMLMQELIDKHNHLSYDELIEILKDHRNGLKYPQGKKSITNEGTIQSFIFDLTNKIIIMSNGDKRPVSLTGKYVKIQCS